MDEGRLKDGVTPRLVQWCLARHRALLPHYRDLRAYYEGRDPGIMGRVYRGEPDHPRLPHPYAHYIALTASSYLTGRPIRYDLPGKTEALDAVLDCYRLNNIDSVDSELSLTASIYGKAVERVYLDRQGRPRSCALPPDEAVVIYDDTAAHEPLLGITCVHRPPVGREPGSVTVQAMTDREVLTFTAPDERDLTCAEVVRHPHYFGGIPLIEYWNNFDETGDFERVLPLIDGYDSLQSDRLHDKLRFADSLLVLTGCQLEAGWHTRLTEGPDGTSVEERVPDESPAERLRRERCLSLPDSDASAQYLTHTLHEADTEVLRAALKDDIHRFSFVPDLSDRMFADNQSGVAMRYKLLGLEQLVSVKERWFREALRARIRLYARVLSLGGKTSLDADRVQMTFSRPEVLTYMEDGGSGE